MEACAACDVDAVALRVHGKPHVAGIYVLQILDDVPHLERLCAFQAHVPSWEGSRVTCMHGETWDAAVGNRVPRGGG